MRPVDLTPPEQRHGTKPPTRTGPLPYMLLALLVIILLGVVAVVYTSNEIADARADLENLEFQTARLNEQANELAPYVDFAEIASKRKSTVAALAQSRFDWYRVLQELALVLPEDVWLVNLTATVGPGVALQGAAQVGNRAEIDSPAIEMIGCASSQTKVAQFLAALEDIDGVTRVGLESSSRRDPSGSSQGDGGESDECRTKNFIWKFSAIAAFDAVPAPPGSDVPVAPVEPSGNEEEPGEDGSETTNEEDGQ